MTEALTSAIASETGRLADIPDLVERFHAVREFRQTLADGDRTGKALEQAVVSELKQDRPWREVGALLGMSGSRAEQIAKGRGPLRHDAESTPPAGAAEGHQPDADQP
ncbi:hypothetical protein ABT215_11105 [Streptomyces sp900105755]|uniref:hypothetical protein n=1 Tax=Streptomyces sp. 900105755 TaxID=3154389 RepID=UPI003328B12D